MGIPHDVEGPPVYAIVTLTRGAEAQDDRGAIVGIGALAEVRH